MEGFSQPPVRVLAESALIPEKNLIVPAPNCFTHKCKAPMPYFYGDVPSDTPDGTLPAGAEVVVLVHHGGAYCRVADRQGLYVMVEYGGLAKL